MVFYPYTYETEGVFDGDAWVVVVCREHDAGHLAGAERDDDPHSWLDPVLQG